VVPNITTLDMVIVVVPVPKYPVHMDRAANVLVLHRPRQYHMPPIYDVLDVVPNITTLDMIIVVVPVPKYPVHMDRAANVLVLHHPRQYHMPPIHDLLDMVCLRPALISELVSLFMILLQPFASIISFIHIMSSLIFFGGIPFLLEEDFIRPLNTIIRE